MNLRKINALGRWVALAAFCTTFLAITGCASLIKPKLKQEIVEIKKGEYTLDPAHSTILFKVDHMGFSTFVGRFNTFDANLSFNPDDIAQSQLEAVVDMTSVDVNNPKFERALKGRFWFDTVNFPQAYFKTTSAEILEGNRVKFLGELSFLGETKPIELFVNVNGAANNLLTQKYTLGFSASTTFNRSEFGLDRYVPTVGDAIELEIHAEFQRQ